MENHLKRVLSLVRKTGDTMIVVDKDGQESFVVMDLDQYEFLLDSQVDFDEDLAEPLDKSIEEAGFSEEPNIWDVMPEAGEESETWDMDALSDEEMGDLERQYKAFATRHKQAKEEIEPESAPAKGINALDTNHPAQTPVSSQDEDEYGEEQFYLEPVE
mgnify:CR=1 FL=1